MILICFRSSMDRALASEAGDLGSSPNESTILKQKNQLIGLLVLIKNWWRWRELNPRALCLHIRRLHA